MSRRIKFHDAMGLGGGWYVGAEDAGDGGVRAYVFREETRAERRAALVERDRAGPRGWFRDGASDLPRTIEHEQIRKGARRRWYGAAVRRIDRRRDESGPVELRRLRRPVPQRGDEQDLIRESLVRMAGSASDAQQYRDQQEYGRRHADLWRPHTADAAERDFRRRLKAAGMSDADTEYVLAEVRQGRPGGVEGRERLGVRTNAGADAGERLRPYYAMIGDPHRPHAARAAPHHNHSHHYR